MAYAWASAQCACGSSDEREFGKAGGEWRTARAWAGMRRKPFHTCSATLRAQLHPHTSSHPARLACPRTPCPACLLTLSTSHPVPGPTHQGFGLSKA
eukprot:156036-Chlamydomonas_euryale.AAC.4